MSNSDEKNLAQAIKLIGDAYVLLIISNLAKKSMRFNELQRSAVDICPATLSDRLRKLERKKFISRKEETVDKLSVVYELTDKGRGVLPVVKAIGTFSEKYL